MGSGRFDDPARQFRVVYAAAQRRGALVESLAPLRAKVQGLAALRGIRASGEPLPRPTIPAAWFRIRAIGRLQLAPRQRWLDLRALATREALRGELAPLLWELGLDEFDLSSVTSANRRLTQALARWARERGAAGLVYHSRFDSRLACWAIFECVVYAPVGPAAPLDPADPDVRAVARVFGFAAGEQPVTAN